MAPGRKNRSRRDEPTHDTRDRAAQEIERLRDENERLRKQLEEQATRIADLERQLALKQQNSTSTSKPPSSDGLAGQPRTRGRRVKSRRKPGGPPGHPGHHRALVSVERVDATVDREHSRFVQVTIVLFWAFHESLPDVRLRRPAQVADSGRNTLPEQIGNAPRSISHRRRAAAVRAVCTRGIPSVTRARMSPRNTTTGAVLENMIIPALDRGGYAHVEQFNIGTRLGGGRHIIDVLAEQDGRRLLVSLKWQQSSGTAEQKVPFEAICLAECLRSDARFARGAYLVLGGEGWTLRSFYVGGGLQHHLVHADKVNIMTLEAFVALANRGEL